MKAALGEDGLPIAWSQTFLAGPTRNEGLCPALRDPEPVDPLGRFRHASADRHLACGRPHAARLLDRDASSTSSRMPPGATPTSTAARCCRRARANGACSTPRPRTAGWGKPLPAGHGPRHRDRRELRHDRGACRRGVDRRTACRGCIASSRRSIAARWCIPTPRASRSKARSSWD